MAPATQTQRSNGGKRKRAHTSGDILDALLAQPMAKKAEPADATFLALLDKPARIDDFRKLDEVIHSDYEFDALEEEFKGAYDARCPRCGGTHGRYYLKGSNAHAEAFSDRAIT